jgi:hypothetical protein
MLIAATEMLVRCKYFMVSSDQLKC